jgi:transcriptional regulator of acetoin/glycerol metabolism
VRRFIAVIERAVILAMSDVVELPALPVQMWIPTEPVTLAERERDQNPRALEKSGSVVGGASGAAARLGVPRTTFVDKMRRHRLSRETVRGGPERTNGFRAFPPGTRA